MANVMSMRNLRNKVSRNGFDLSHRNAFTAKPGELLPVYVEECLPGDKFKISPQWFTRTQPLNTSAFVRMREYVDFYAVPYDLMWRDAPNFFVQSPDYNRALDITRLSFSTPTRHPYFTSQQLFDYFDNINKAQMPWPEQKLNYVGYDRIKQTYKLLEYLGYGQFTHWGTASMSGVINLLNPFPLLAYQKVYQDYFRDSQWEVSQPERCNVDYLRDTGVANSLMLPIESLFNPKDGYSAFRSYNLFDLNYVNWKKDYFTGVLPKAQY